MNPDPPDRTIQAATLEMRMKDLERFSSDLQQREAALEEKRRNWEQQMGGSVDEIARRVAEVGTSSLSLSPSLSSLLEETILYVPFKPNPPI